MKQWKHVLKAWGGVFVFIWQLYLQGLHGWACEPVL